MTTGTQKTAFQGHHRVRGIPLELAEASAGRNPSRLASVDVTCGEVVDVARPEGPTCIAAWSGDLRSLRGQILRPRLRPAPPNVRKGDALQVRSVSGTASLPRMTAPWPR